MYDGGSSRRDCLPENQRSDVTTKDARLLSQLIEGEDTAPSFRSLTSMERVKMRGITHHYCLVIGRVDYVYSKPKNDEHDDNRMPSSSR